MRFAHDMPNNKRVLRALRRWDSKTAIHTCGEIAISRVCCRVELDQIDGHQGQN